MNNKFIFPAYKLFNTHNLRLDSNKCDQVNFENNASIYFRRQYTLLQKGLYYRDFTEFKISKLLEHNFRKLVAYELMWFRLICGTCNIFFWHLVIV